MTGWQYLDERGTFRLQNPQQTSALYFPLVNETGFTAVITPTLHGDIKADHHSYLMPPVSVTDLHTSRTARNFWVAMEGERPWSVGGNSAWQLAQRFTAAEESVTLTAGLLWHQVTRENATLGLRAEVTNFVPASQDRVELMRVTLTNTSTAPLTLAATAAIPIYGRSADNQRDHRHVTSLLHRIRTQRYGVLVQPTLSFDERGHKPNHLTYAVLGAAGDGTPPMSFWPVLEDFVGEGGTLDWPQAVAAPPHQGMPVGTTVDGYEAMGGLCFQSVTLMPNESVSYVLVLAILSEGDTVESLLARYGNEMHFATWLARTQAYWADKLDTWQVHTGDAQWDGWLRWVALQPTLRRWCGNSYLPYHDYGRGGRGWRDLWQDLLALLMMEPEGVRPLLLSNFAGVRLDGSNATIIGSQPGEFKADRNNIPRVWMDHGAWPLLTTQLYLDTTGDLEFLLQPQVYFKDRWSHRAQQVDRAWQPEQGTQQKTAVDTVYTGTVLEHLLVQHLIAFFNVGEHNIIRLEGADWNDGLDMGRDRGESVAFTALYAANLRQIGQLVQQLAAAGHEEVVLAAELRPLLDTLDAVPDYAAITAKQQRLTAYFNSVNHTLSGETITIPAAALAADLTAKADWLADQLRQQEWIAAAGGLGWYNGYYDDDGCRVEGVHPHGVRMTLTGQTFTLMSGIATSTQAAQIVRAADQYLFDETMGGYRLNTDFGAVLLNLGRMFGFAFGHKENGAMFSHMAVMFAYALYQRGLAAAGFRALDALYRHSQDFSRSHMYPGLPEYINPRGRGMYPYLTGSASWYLLTVLTQMFGVHGVQGDLRLAPQLMCQQFGENGRLSLTMPFADRQLRVTYHNPDRLEFGDYHIGKVTVNGRNVPLDDHSTSVTLPRASIQPAPLASYCDIQVFLQ